MILAKIAIARPVFTVMVMLALLVLGLFAYRDLSVEMFPDISFPFVVVTVQYPGASPETMETEIVAKVERDPHRWQRDSLHRLLRGG